MENDKLKRFIKTIREFLNENINNEILTPDYYLDDFYSMDFNDEYSEEQAKIKIQKVIDYVLNLKYPIMVYRGFSDHHLYELPLNRVKFMVVVLGVREKKFQKVLVIKFLLELYQIKMLLM